jgi:hypothetical protein
MKMISSFLFHQFQLNVLIRIRKAKRNCPKSPRGSAKSFCTTWRSVRNSDSGKWAIWIHATLHELLPQTR